MPICSVLPSNGMGRVRGTSVRFAMKGTLQQMKKHMRVLFPIHRVCGCSIRALNREERNVTEREGLCVGCHQYYNTPGWEKIITKYGRAETAEQHEDMVSEAIKLLMENTK